MSSRPSKRQKVHALNDSEDDESHPSSIHQAKVPVPASKSVSIRSKRNSKLSSNSEILTKNEAKSKPDQSHRRKNQQQELSTSKPISAFFGPASTKNQQILQQSTKQKAAETDVRANLGESSQNSEIVEEIDDLSDESTSERQVTTSSKPTRPVKQNLSPRAKSQGLSGHLKSDKVPRGNQRFKGIGVQENNDDKTKHVLLKDQRPWSQRFQPRGVDELAVHKKKISDVRSWLERAIDQKHTERALILKGPAGSGKTSTVKALADDIGIEITEWKNPVGNHGSSGSYSSLSSQFEDFLGRSYKYAGLEFKHESDSTTAFQRSGHLSHSNQPYRKIILVEEFPSTIGSSSVALQSFRTVLSQYFAAISMSLDGIAAQPDIPPLVMIITESRTTSSRSTADSFTMHRLLGADIITHPSIRVIEFNPVAVTYLKKALDLVLQREARESGRRRVPGPCVLKKLCEVGDISSAIGALEFLCINAGDERSWSGTVASIAKKGIIASSEMSQMERDLLSLVVSRHVSVGLFHAVGKIVYNKRVELAEGSSEDATATDHQQMVEVPEVSLDQLMDECDTDVETFVAALHENYVSSCEGANFADSVEGCLDALSDGDILQMSGTGNGRYRFNSAAQLPESLKQDDIVFHLVTRGLLFALPYPVRRSAAPPGGPHAPSSQSSAYQMRYPSSMRLSRQVEDSEELVKKYQSRNSSTATEAHLPMHSTGLHGSEERIDQLSPPEYLSSPDALLLERLPYSYQIQQSHNPASALLKDLEALTQFRGTPVMDYHISFEDTEEEESQGARNVRAPDIKERSADAKGNDASSVSLRDVEPRESNLYLTEDDIEDE